ncbi:outer membrane beta-barrel protein [Paraglaciecola sp. L3A3]|uniref:outer membrane beta-barrel protein n=1 Tax=Paraglaciecola sp. L3A3 TaxID=2686358 RepID=UPI00131A836D|nr:outer membrane beta-barrel protein [Paraglaciecola sp. L3A3]
MKVFLSAISLAMVISTSALAASTSPWFVHIGTSTMVDSESEQQALINLESLGHQPEDYTFDLPSGGIQLDLGYTVSENWALTFGYMEFGKSTFIVDVDTAYADEAIGEINKALPRYGNGLTSSVIYSYPITPEFNISAEAGALLLESQYEINYEIGVNEQTNEPIMYSVTTSDTSLQWFAGAGVNYVYKSTSLGLYYRHYEIDRLGSQSVGVRLGYHF